MPPMIDAHHHFWTVDRGDYGWLTPDMGVIYRDFGPEDLAPHLARNGVAQTILVQAAPSVAETAFLLDIAARTPFVAGVVGWADFAAADAVEVIGRLAANPLLVGLRPMVQDIADDAWLSRSGLAPAFDALVRHGLVFDALVLPRHLAPLLDVLKRHPGLPVVVDHLAKPHIAAGILDPWRADIAAVAAFPSVSCKLSGMATEAQPDWIAADLKPFSDHILTQFGPERVLWGSDWPVVNLAGGYNRWRTATNDLLKGFSPAQTKAILGGNAARVYLTQRGKKPVKRSRHVEGP